MRWKRNSINALTFNLFIVCYQSYFTLCSFVATYLCSCLFVCVYLCAGCSTGSSCCFHTWNLWQIYTRIHEFTLFGCARIGTLMLVSSSFHINMHIYRHVCMYMKNISRCCKLSAKLASLILLICLHVLLLRINAVAPTPQTQPSPQLP